MRKVICDSPLCDWKGMKDEVLNGTNPFDPTELIYGCPECLQINTTVYACDEPDCWMEVTCGTPTEDGYRSTCGLHAPKDKL